MIARSRGEGLDPGERDLLDDVEPLPFGGQLAAPLRELEALLVEPLPQGGHPVGGLAIVSPSAAMVTLPSSSGKAPRGR